MERLETWESEETEGGEVPSAVANSTKLSVGANQNGLYTSGQAPSV